MSTTPGNAPTQQADLLGRIVAGMSGKYRFVPVLIAIAVIWAIFYFANERFLSPRNLTNLAIQIVVTAILALGLVLVLIIKEIDLSIAALSAASAAVMGYLLVTLAYPVWVAVPAAIVCGAVIGAVQGFIITRFKAPAFIVTLGTSLAMQGFLLTLMPRSGSIPLSGSDVQFIANSFLEPMWGYALVAVGVAGMAVLLQQSAMQKKAHGIEQNVLLSVWLPVLVLGSLGLGVVAVLNADRGVPTPVAILFAVLALMSYVTTQTAFGTHLYALGGNAEASRRSAINIGKVRMIVFVMAGAFAGLAGIISASRTLGVSAQSGGGTLLLEAVAAAVIGGASLFGGRGSVWAALIGALLIGSISNGLSLLSAPTELKFFVQGAVLVLAVIVDSTLARQSNKY